MISTLDLTSLNPQQREAVTWPGGPIQIFAGAGSGKTRVITMRIARLLQEGVAPHRILAVTFTNKAAKEMRERLEQIIGPTAHKMWIGTFHSICSKMLRYDGHHIGVDPRFVVYDDSDQLGLIKEILRQKNIDEKSANPRSILSVISQAKESLTTPEQFNAKATGYFERLVAEIYPKYVELLHRASAMDFDDILCFAVRLLQESQEVREKYQHQFEHVLIDEYQDVNFVQYSFAKLVSEKHKNLTIVGDDDQSIYAWRGADVSLMLRFSSDYPDAKVITLAQNYRSTKKILQAAYEVIRHNRGRCEKQLWTENNDGAQISISETSTEQDEAMLVAETILKEVRQERRKFGDFAVLYRTNAQSRVVEEVFLTMRLPHLLIGGQRFYDRKEIKDMICYLRLALNPHDSASLLRVINTPARGIGNTTITKIQNWSAENEVSLWDAIGDPEFQKQLTPKILTSLQHFRAFIEKARENSFNGPVTPIFQTLLNRSTYVDALRAERTEESISRLENLQEFLNVTQQYDASHDEPSLTEFLENIALMADIDSLNNNGDAVKLMTIHSSKGLEFPVVFLVGMEEGVFPHSRYMDSNLELEEERRLCYVGMTRAREDLHLLHATRRALYGQPKFNPRSRFVADVPEEITTTLLNYSNNKQDLPRLRQDRSGHYGFVNTPTSKPAAEKPELRSPSWKSPFNVGDKVRHVKFGMGVVIACNPVKNDAEVTVAFPGVTGVKKLLQSLAKLEKA